MVSVPERAGPGVGATVNAIAPGPLPEDAPWSEIHGTSVVALQGQPDAAATLTTALPPDAGALCDVGLTL
jgi:hypothetical protein